MSKRRRRRHEEQRRLIQEWNESGESASAFAARIGVASNTLYRWRATRIKLLWFDRNGLCLLYKRLHRAVFELPAAVNGAVSIHIDSAALARLLAGVGKDEKRRTAA